MPLDWVKRLADPGTGRFISTAPTRFKHKFAGGEVEVTMNTAALRVFARNSLRELLSNVCDDAVKGAKLRVRPGVGPGPHPHRTDTGWVHEDTGKLGNAIGWAFEQLVGINETQALVYVDAGQSPYGLWLELGWTGPSGRFYRYPFIVPATEFAMRNASRYVRSIGLLSAQSGAPE